MPLVLPLVLPPVLPLALPLALPVPQPVLPQGLALECGQGLSSGLLELATGANLLKGVPCLVKLFDVSCGLPP